MHPATDSRYHHLVSGATADTVLSLMLLGRRKGNEHVPLACTTRTVTATPAPAPPVPDTAQDVRGSLHQDPSITNQERSESAHQGEEAYRRRAICAAGPSLWGHP